jgi:hypothetical protein
MVGAQQSVAERVCQGILLRLYGGERAMAEDQSRYLSYLLRLWLDTGEGKTAWRSSLEDTRTGERHGFLSLEALYTYLVEQTRCTEGMNAKLEPLAPHADPGNSPPK